MGILKRREKCYVCEQSFDAEDTIVRKVLGIIDEYLSAAEKAKLSRTSGAATLRLLRSDIVEQFSILEGN